MHTQSKRKKWRWKNKKCAHELNCLFLFSFRANRPVYLFVKISGTESLRVSERWEEKKRRKQLETIEWIQGWLFFLTHSHSHSHAQCVSIWFNFPNDTIQFQGDIRHFQFSQWVWIIYAPKNKVSQHDLTHFSASTKPYTKQSAHTNISAENETPTEYNIVLEATMKDRDAGIRCNK